MSSFLLSPKEDKAKTSGVAFLEAEKADKECLAM